MTVGWKLEIASKKRDLSVKVPLTDEEIREYVYRGTNQPNSKKNYVLMRRYDILENEIWHRLLLLH
jgi:hypothetical protein